MRFRTLKIVLAVLVAVVGISAAHAASTTNVIVVTPENMEAMGWTSLATQLKKQADIPELSMYEARCGFSVVPEGAVDLPGYGPGGFWMNTGNYQLELTLDKVNQVFLGTNNYSNIKLSDIRKLYYKAFSADYNTFDFSHYPRTPIALQLAVTKNASSTAPNRYLMYRGWDPLIDASTPEYPYLQKIQHYSGESPYDGNYMRFNGQDCYTGGNGAWIDFVGQNYDGTKPFIGDWPNVLRKYAGGKILAGSGYYPDSWYHTQYPGENPIRSCLSFVLGTPHDEPGDSISIKWGDNINQCAWLDYFVIGYNKDSDPNQYTEDWIYFRPDPTPGRVATTIKSAWDSVILHKPLGWKGNTFVLYGKVLENPAPNGGRFTIEDGSGTGYKVRVKITGDWMEFYPVAGSFVRVEGVLHRYGLKSYVPDLFVDADDVLVIVEP